MKYWKTIKNVSTVGASFLMAATLGFNVYAFGNMNPYVTSYLRNVTGDHDVSYTDTLWIFQASLFTTCATMLVIGQFALRLHFKLYMLAGIIFNAGALFGTYFALSHSFALTLVTYGVLAGLPTTFIDPTTIRISVQWNPERKGLVAGIILMGYGVGSLCWNAFTTWFINSNNLEPDLKIGEDSYYTQSAVLDKVPQCFWILGIVVIPVQLFSLVVMSSPPHPTLNFEDKGRQSPVVNETKERQSLRLPSEDTEQRERPCKVEEETYQQVKGQGGQDWEQSENSGMAAGRCESDVSVTSTGLELTPRQVIKTRIFWTIWFMYVFCEVGFAFVNGLWKAYGQSFIEDDHFLAAVASVSSVFNALGRPLFGYLADRFGVRLIALLSECALAAFVASFVICEYVAREAFFFWVCALFLSMCGFFTTMQTLLLVAFGPKHYNANLGLFQSSGLIGAVLPTVIAPAVKSAFGWHGLFFTGFAGLFLGVLLNMSLSLRCDSCWPMPALMVTELAL